jgi:uncharacterized protein YoxC
MPENEISNTILAIAILILVIIVAYKILKPSALVVEKTETGWIITEK